ncbi:tripartite tricarboxylate transporter substrate binding protein [Cupriavidus malaysiensis]|uniref:ABC transporter substrate-binding protein n=1 Tax=Cupriavidus malaysiensis TaxID=367825 RepID=A0ABM6F1Q4_9BURK|nr:tripartite tricarboxylate transporter substrate binding protein [Cupriavidus malaysiensis]AOZ05296.1 ABC transporter substrate-binding protein [Cupriavidus malaysiensis]
MHKNSALQRVARFAQGLAAAGALVGAIAPLPARADTAAAVPPLVRIVVPFSAGASNDVIARALAPGLARRLGANVIVENKPGAAGAMGADFVARAPRDGSVLLLTSSTFLTAAATQPRSPYDAIAAFAPVAMVGNGPLLLAVSAAKPFHTPAELLAAAKARPGAITYGSAGIGSLGQMATELLSDAAKVRMMHVPYKGASNALLDLSAGQIDVMIGNYSSMAPQIRSGKVRALAVTSQRPSAAFPDLPALGATVPGYEMDIWVGVLAPAGTPAALVQRLNREINDTAASSEMRAVLDPDGALPQALSPADFAARMKQELAQWKRLAVEHKIVVE